jgi:hypothetical protein
MNGYNGFSIELKTPKGTWLKLLRERGHRTMISNDYTDIVLRIDEYFRVDLTEKHKKEKSNLRKQCNILKKKLSEAVVCYRPRIRENRY